MKKLFLAIGFACCTLFSFGTTVQGATVDISLNPTNWSLSPYAYQDSPTPTLTLVGNNLQGTIPTANGGSAYGIEIETNDTFNFQNATLRFQWLVGLSSYSQASTHLSSTEGNLSHYIANNGLFYGFTTGWSYANSQKITNNTWLYTEITYNPTGLDYTVSYDGYGVSPISSGTNTYSSTTWGFLDEAMFRFRLADNYGAGQYFQFGEVTLITPDPVPIPGALWLLGSGLLGLVGLRRKKA